MVFSLSGEEVARMLIKDILIVKDNQPELKAQIQAALHDDAAFSPLPA